MQNGGQNFANIAVGFQELSHNQKMEVLNKLDLSKLDAAGTAKIAQTEIEEGHKTTRFSTLITAVTFTVGILAVFSSTNKTSDNNYKLRRPRSLSEKIFGDK